MKVNDNEWQRQKPHQSWATIQSSWNSLLHAEKVRTHDKPTKPCTQSQNWVNTNTERYSFLNWRANNEKATEKNPKEKRNNNVEWKLLLSSPSQQMVSFGQTCGKGNSCRVPLTHTHTRQPLNVNVMALKRVSMSLFCLCYNNKPKQQMDLCYQKAVSEFTSLLALSFPMQKDINVKRKHFYFSFPVYIVPKWNRVCETQRTYATFFIVEWWVWWKKIIQFIRLERSL